MAFPQVVNGGEVKSNSIWECKWPQCWTIVVLYLSQNQWGLFSFHDNLSGATLGIHTGEGGAGIRTYDEVCKWLKAMDAKYLKDKRIRIQTKE